MFLFRCWIEVFTLDLCERTRNSVLGLTTAALDALNGGLCNCALCSCACILGLWISQCLCGIPMTKGVCLPVWLWSSSLSPFTQSGWATIHTPGLIFENALSRVNQRDFLFLFIYFFYTRTSWLSWHSVTGNNTIFTLPVMKWLFFFFFRKVVRNS